MKKFPKKIKMRFLNIVTVPKNVKGGTIWDFLTSIVLQNVETNEGGTLWDFLTSIVLQNVETNEGGTLWCNPKSFKKIA